MTCITCGQRLDPSARYCSGCGQALTIVNPPPPRADRLVRPREGRMIAGVCAGFAHRFGWDIALVRLVLVLAVVFGAGMPLIAYGIAWVVMPNAQFALPAQSGAGPGSIAM